MSHIHDYEVGDEEEEAEARRCIDEANRHDNDEADDGGSSPDAAAALVADGTRFPSPPADSVLPPVGQRGLQPDPGYAVFSSPDGHGQRSVGRFRVLDESPPTRPLGESDAAAVLGRLSPMPLEEGEGESTPLSSPPSPAEGVDTRAPTRQQSLAPPSSSPAPSSGASPSPSPAPPATTALSSMHHANHSDLPHVFYTPHFPAMNINGGSVTLSLSISVLPPHGVSISPSAQGVEFSPPKLRFSAHGRREAMFTVTPLPGAKEGKIKVCYIVSGDDAAEYSEPPCSTLTMYNDTLPVPSGRTSPSPELTPQSGQSGALFSPIMSDGSERSGAGSGHSVHRGVAHAEDVASGATPTASSHYSHTSVPRQSGRFEVIDMDEQGDETSPPASAATPLPTPSPPSLDDNPFDLLSRLQRALTRLAEDNARLRAENHRLLQENAELRLRGTIEPPDNRFGGRSVSHPTGELQHSAHAHAQQVVPAAAVAAPSQMQRSVSHQGSGVRVAPPTASSNTGKLGANAQRYATLSHYHSSPSPPVAHVPPSLAPSSASAVHPTSSPSVPRSGAGQHAHSSNPVRSNGSTISASLQCVLSSGGGVPSAMDKRATLPANFSLANPLPSLSRPSASSSSLTPPAPASPAVNRNSLSVTAVSPPKTAPGSKPPVSPEARSPQPAAASHPSKESTTPLSRSKTGGVSSASSVGSRRNSTSQDFQQSLFDTLDASLKQSAAEHKAH